MQSNQRIHRQLSVEQQQQFNILRPNVAGVDEVGRGPLAGPVTAAAVILDPQQPITGLRDSKKLSEKKRLALFAEIKAKALAYCITQCSPAEIDQYNILNASLLAMRRAVLGLSLEPQQVLVDGNRCPDLPYSMDAIVGGDDLIGVISAASILAKVTRDAEMRQLDESYPGYGLAQHKGYPTKQHLQALQQLGVLPIHRRSFAPVARLLEAKSTEVES